MERSVFFQVLQRVHKTKIPRMKQPANQKTIISPLPEKAELIAWPAPLEFIFPSSIELVATQ